MKITIYELLGMVKEGKELPKKIKYEKHIYEYQEGSYDWEYYNNGIIKFLLTDEFNGDDNILSILNYEVEILEEEKKIPEKLYGKVNLKEGICKAPSNEQLMHKINEIIDYLKSKGDE